MLIQERKLSAKQRISEIPDYIKEQAELSGEPQVGYMKGDRELCPPHLHIPA